MSLALAGLALVVLLTCRMSFYDRHYLTVIQQHSTLPSLEDLSRENDKHKTISSFIERCDFSDFSLSGQLLTRVTYSNHLHQTVVFQLQLQDINTTEGCASNTYTSIKWKVRSRVSLLFSCSYSFSRSLL